MSRNDITPSQLEVRSATVNDLAFLYDLVRATMRCYVEMTWGGWDEDWQHNRFAERFDHMKWSILLLDQEPVGGFAIEYRSTEMYLMNLHILPDKQGLGLGTATVQMLLVEAAERGVPLTLNVIRSNVGARRLYERMGLRVVEEEDRRFWMTSETLRQHK
jgi:ribosomal protein S18 acetylase RimI-like enzyme